MTREDTIKILSVLKGIGVKFEGDTDIIINIWADCFQKDEYLKVNNAIKKLMTTEKQLFQNGLIAKIKDLLVPDDVFIDSATAWNQVRVAMKKSHPDIPKTTNDAFEELDPIIKKVLGNSHTLIEWEYESTTENLNTVIKSNFIREYNHLCKIYKDDLKNGGKMLEFISELKELPNQENIKRLENLAKETVKSEI